jgi:hypothetical protein
MTYLWTASSKAYAPFALLTSILAVSVLVPPVREAVLPGCLLHLLFGVAGPGCGMTRAFLFIGHGDLHSAVTLNPNSPLAFTLVVALWTNQVIRVLCGREVVLVLSRRWKVGVYLVTAALTAAAWIYNVTLNPWT